LPARDPACQTSAPLPCEGSDDAAPDDPEFGEGTLVDPEGGEARVPDDEGADDESLGGDEPLALPAPAGALRADPEPVDGSRLAEGAITDGIDGVGTVGM
jgi:hypothetical protein